MKSKLDWCIEQHKNTNHYYDVYLPYEFHLRMVGNVYEDFKHLLDDTVDYFTGESIVGWRDNPVTLREACYDASFGHDLIEDTRCSFNEVQSMLGQAAAEIIYAVSNEKGKTRKERANDNYYKGIRETKGAIFVKLCDRIANVQYSKMTKSRMFKMYEEENDHFLQQLGYKDAKLEPYTEMVNYLLKLFYD
jgi:(p)ppGpp synthase/HD superfamily hydrolase